MFTISKWSPNTRITILTLAVFLVGICALTFYAGHIQQNDTQRMLGEQQFSTVAIVAEEINAEMEGRLRALGGVATKITPAMLGNTTAMQKLLESHPDLESLFNAGTFVTGIDGMAIASTPLSLGRAGANYSDRDYITAALKEGRATVGRPVIGKHQKTPVFSMATPVRDAQGVVIGALVGVNNLGRANFLNRVTDNHYGKNGGYLIVAAKQRLIAAATDKKRIMETLPAPGVNPFIDRALNGFEGFGISTTPQGVQVLISTKVIPAAGWVVAAQLPTAEAFAPIKSMQQRLLLAALLITLLVSALAMWVIKIQRVSKLLEDLVEKRAEELQRSEQRFRSFVENVNDVLFALTPEGLFSYVSPQWQAAFGYELKETIGRPFFPFIHPDDVPGCLAFLRQVIETDQKQGGIEYRVLCKDGAYLWYRANASLMKDPEKGVLLVGIGRDITKEKLTEEMLQQFNELLDKQVYERTADLAKSENKITQLLQSTDQGIYGVDPDGYCTFINRAAMSILGYHRDDECIGMNMHNLIHHSYSTSLPYPVADCPICHTRTTGLDVNVDNEVLWRKDGTSFPAEYSSHAIIENGIISGTVITFSDITESKKLKEQLLQSQKMEAVGQLAGGLAHDFNNVLSVINGYCCLLQMDAEQNEERKEYIERILTASTRAGDLTHSMLAFSRTQVMNPQNQNLNGIVAKTGCFIEKIIGENILFKTVAKEAALPVFVDGGQIEQVLINLCNNARDAMPNGGALTIVTDGITMDAAFITAHRFGTPGRFAVITVTDTGTGMDEATRKKIFEPFFSTKTVDKGTGLGLAMVYGITKQHNGFVDAYSTPGQGACFTIYLPLVETKTTVSNVNTADGGQTSVGTETILIAEDSADIRDFMEKALTMLGYQVICAVDGQDAVEKFKEHADSIDLVIMDMIMPNKSGKAAYEEIKQIKPEAKALFSSGHSASTIQQQGELGKNVEFISKPLQPAVLLKKVREILER